jgi:excisionase family DNA binding protein
VVNVRSTEEVTVEKKVVLDVWEVAQLLGIHRLSVRRAIERGELRAVRVGRRVLVPRKTLDEFLENRPTAAAK